MNLLDVYPPPLLPTSWEHVVLPVDKPQGWTSFDVIRRLRRLLSIRKIGHAGTLDPMATGLLICLVGLATKRMEAFMELPKTYTGTIRLGQSTPSYDADSDVTENHPWQHLTDADLEDARQQFLGSIAQIPPMYSALKIGGERLYKKARRGEDVERASRQVEIYSFDLLERNGQDVDFVLRCTKGTYVRSIAHDFGQVLGAGAHLVRLRRTAIGDLTVDKAWTMDRLEECTQ